MPLAFRAAGSTAAGGVALTVSQPIDPAVQVGDLILWAVAASENTRGWGSGINNAGSVTGFNDLSTAAIASVWSGRSQYLQDDGFNPRRWLWLGYRVATIADTGGPTYTASLNSAPAFGVGIASAYVVYANPAAAGYIGNLDAVAQGNGGTGGTVTAPVVAAPGGNVGPYTFTVSITTGAWKAAQTTVLIGNAADALAVALAYGEGGAGVWVPPAGLTARTTWGGLGGPWYMLTWADGFAPGSANLGRLPLLGAG